VSGVNGIDADMNGIDVYEFRMQKQEVRIKK
jgi:hypothetical protein